ncbi:hypothetical protein [Streptomyces incanus]|uniref:Uncharacterized protein n=1 Tax=Streptomyces incanus TaxID=887453 RepID=A0ABW0XNS4_9ACTN
MDRLVDALEEAPPTAAAVRRSRSAPDSSTGELARLVVGGAVLAVVAVHLLVLRRPPWAGG